MNNLTFEELPKAVANIQLKLDEICSLLENKQNSPKQSQDELLTVPDAATFLSISVPTIYGLISKGELPVMKRSKRCYFSKLELINYLKEGRKKTNSEIEAIAEKHMTKAK
ncbi:MAG: helix-turn-helix domain-containing protein [Saprospiraceae bacterium]|nr:helix-turn-helix domain-containing protein [Saprospiraceae bacterium]